MAIKNYCPFIIFFILCNPLFAQKDTLNVFEKAVLFIDSIYCQEMLYWEGNGDTLFFEKDNDTPLFYDLYSCSCIGKHDILTDTPINNLVKKLHLQYGMTRRDKKDLGYPSATVFVLCNKKNNDGGGDYIECRVINTKQFKKTIRIRIFFCGNTIISYSIINDYVR